MQSVKRCERCNTINDSNEVYCRNCSNFLSFHRAHPSESVNVWSISFNPANAAVSGNKNHLQDRYVVVCPECELISEAQDEILPLACSHCGYFFQSGADRVVSESSLKTFKSQTNQPSDINRTSKSDEISKGESSSNEVKKNPLPKAKKDNSRMRLFFIDRRDLPPVNVGEKGDIIGKDGSILNMRNTSDQISLWHTNVGWYARILEGHPLYNGVPINQGIQIKLKDGDILMMEGSRIMVEIA